MSEESTVRQRSSSLSSGSPRSRSASLSSPGGRSRSSSLTKGQKKKIQKKRSKLRTQLEQQGASPEEIEKALAEMQDSEKDDEDEQPSTPPTTPQQTPKNEKEPALRSWAQKRVPNANRTGKTYLEMIAERRKQNGEPTPQNNTTPPNGEENGAPLRKWATMSALGRYRSISLPRGRSYKELVAQKQAEQQRQEVKANLSQKILKRGEFEYITENNPTKDWEIGYFTLSDSTLIYFDNMDEEFPTCIVDLSGAKADIIEHPQKKFCFKVISQTAHAQDTVLKGHIMVLSATSEEEREQWIQIINSTSEHAKEEAEVRKHLSPLTRYQLEKLVVELKRSKNISDDDIKELIKDIALPSQQVEQLPESNPLYKSIQE